MGCLHRFKVYVENKVLDTRLAELERKRADVERLEKLIGLPTTREQLVGLFDEVVSLRFKYKDHDPV